MSLPLDGSLTCQATTNPSWTEARADPEQLRYVRSFKALSEEYAVESSSIPGWQSIQDADPPIVAVREPDILVKYALFDQRVIYSRLLDIAIRRISLS